MTEEHATKMLQGRDWKLVKPDGSMPWDEPAPAPPAIKGAAGRRPRTRGELAETAELAGVPVPAPDAEPQVFDQHGRPIKPKEKAQEAPEVSEPPQATESQADNEAAEAAATVPLDGEPTEEPEVTIEVSPDMTKTQLREACDAAGIKAPAAANKAQLLDLLQQHGE